MSGVAERGTEGMQGGFGLFEEGIIARALDHMQWPAVPRARSLGHTEPGLEVMAPPDQGRRHRDPHEDIPRDGPDSVRRHEAPESGLRGLRARPLEGIRADWLEALAQLPAQAVEIDEALRQEAIPCLFCRPGNVDQQRQREPGRQSDSSSDRSCRQEPAG